MAVNQVKTDTFEQEVLQAQLPVVVDFWAPWCGYCRMLSPLLEELAEANADKLRVVTVNVDEEPDLASRYGVSSLPTLLPFHNGVAGTPSVGALPREQLNSWLQSIGIL